MKEFEEVEKLLQMALNEGGSSYIFVKAAMEKLKIVQQAIEAKIAALQLSR